MKPLDQNEWEYQLLALDVKGHSRIILEKAIGTLGSGARAASLRDGRGGLLSEGRGDHEQALSATIIAEFSVAEFGDSPGCGLSRLRAKRGCICIKHPTTKYITC